MKKYEFEGIDYIASGNERVNFLMRNQFGTVLGYEKSPLIKSNGNQPSISMVMYYSESSEDSLIEIVYENFYSKQELWQWLIDGNKIMGTISGETIGLVDGEPVSNFHHNTASDYSFDYDKWTKVNT